MSFADAELLGQMPRLRSFARNLTRDIDRAEDLLQDTVVRALSYRSRFEAGTNLRAWACFIMRNLFLSGRRRAKFTGTTYEGAEYDLPAASNLDAVVELGQVMDALSYLPPQQRAALLCVADGTSLEEAAEELGCELGTVKSRVSRARAALDLYFQA